MIRSAAEKGASSLTVTGRGRVMSSGAAKRNSLFSGFSPGPACGLLDRPSVDSLPLWGFTVLARWPAPPRPPTLPPGCVLGHVPSASCHGPSFSQDALGGLPPSQWPLAPQVRAGWLCVRAQSLSSSHISKLWEDGLSTWHVSACVPRCVFSARGRPGLLFFFLNGIWNCDLLPQRKGCPHPSCPLPAR